MDHYTEDNTKRRLTDRREIVRAVDLLRGKGYDNDELARELTRIFYVDLDEYNHVVSEAA